MSFFFERIYHLSVAEPFISAERQKLWGNPKPPYPVESETTIEEALKAAWQWLSDSPRQIHYEEVWQVTKDALGKDKRVRLKDRSIKTLEVDEVFGDWSSPPISEQGNDSNFLPQTINAYNLTFAAQRIADKSNSRHWWTPGMAALYLLTGLSHSPAVTIKGSLQTRQGSNGMYFAFPYAEIAVTDPLQIPPESIANAYRTFLDDFPRETLDNEDLEQLNKGKKRLTARPISKITEILGVLELGLILEEAVKRSESGQSLRREDWSWRPGAKELREAWEARSWEFGQDAKPPSSSVLSQHKSKITRDVYEFAYAHLHRKDPSVEYYVNESTGKVESRKT